MLWHWCKGLLKAEILIDRFPMVGGKNSVINLSITLGASISLSQARANATDSELIHNYFDLLQTIMTEHDLLDKPCQILILTKAGSL